MALVTFAERDGGTDPRGLGFPLNDDLAAFLGQASGCHVVELLPGQLRGNHVHLRQKELLFVMAGVPWSFHWDEGGGTAAQHREFSGRFAVVVTIAPGAAHAVVNRGGAPLLLVGLADRAFDPKAPDCLRRVVAG